MTTEPSQSLQDAIAQNRANPPSLAAVTAKVQAARDLELLIEDQKEALEQSKAKLNHLLMEELPDMMTAAGIDFLGVPAEGNQEAYKAKIKPFFSAQIPADWPDDKRQKAFSFLEAQGAGDLIKTIVTVSFPKEERGSVTEFVNSLRALREVSIIPCRCRFIKRH